MAIHGILTELEMLRAQADFRLLFKLCTMDEWRADHQHLNALEADLLKTFFPGRQRK